MILLANVTLLFSGRRYGFLGQEGDQKVFLDFALKVVLYQPVSQGQGQETPLSAGVARMAQAGAVSEEAAVHTQSAFRARGRGGVPPMLALLRVLASSSRPLQCIPDFD